MYFSLFKIVSEIGDWVNRKDGVVGVDWSPVR